MNKADLVTQVSMATGTSRRVAAQTLDAITTAVRRAVANGDKVTIPGFGTFDKRLRAPLF